MSAEKTDPTFEGWFIVELMGHRRLAGHVREISVGGGAFIRIDVPHEEASKPDLVTQIYNASAIYCLTPTTEEIARSMNRWNSDKLTRLALPAGDMPAPSGSYSRYNDQ